jgi:hypothetical protein
MGEDGMMPWAGGAEDRGRGERKGKKEVKKEEEAARRALRLRVQGPGIWDLGPGGLETGGKDERRRKWMPSDGCYLVRLGRHGSGWRALLVCRR